MDAQNLVLKYLCTEVFPSIITLSINERVISMITPQMTARFLETCADRGSPSFWI